MVEQNRSGAYTEIVYAPAGAKLALMNGQSLTKAFVPLTGGSAAVYNSTGLAYYRHSDWIGSSRFASTPGRAMYYDGAYAPFGEPYAQTGTTDLSFTGMNQDTVANLYDFLAREYGIQGRWPSPDPAGLASVHPTDPQTLNRYAYVRNSPLALTDPLGMKDAEGGDCDPEAEDCSHGGGGGGGGCDPNDPSCGGDGGSGGCDPTADPTCGDGSGGDACNNATCQSTNTCDDSGCSNQTTVTVNANDPSTNSNGLEPPPAMPPTPPARHSYKKSSAMDPASCPSPSKLLGPQAGRQTRA